MAFGGSGWAEQFMGAGRRNVPFEAKLANTRDFWQDTLKSLFGQVGTNLQQLFETGYGLTPEQQDAKYRRTVGRLDPLFEKQRGELSDFYAQQGFSRGGGGAELADMNDLNRKQRETYGDISESITERNALLQQQGQQAAANQLLSLLGIGANQATGQQGNYINYLLGMGDLQSRRSMSQGGDDFGAGDFLKFIFG